MSVIQAGDFVVQRLFIMSLNDLTLCWTHRVNEENFSHVIRSLSRWVKTVRAQKTDQITAIDFLQHIKSQKHLCCYARLVLLLLIV